MGLIMQNGISYGGVDIVKLTQAEYDALPESKNSDGVLYAITDGESSSSGGGTSKPVELTKAQYEALGESTKTDGILYAITDGDELSAKNLEYDGSVTGLGNNVQDAIDELNSNIDEQNKKLQYSSEEINTGRKWLDGKTIYRKSFSGTYDNGTAILDNVSHVILFSGTMLKASVKRIMPYYEYYNGGQFVGTLQLQTDGRLNLVAISNGQAKRATIDVIIEYTKINE